MYMFPEVKQMLLALLFALIFTIGQNAASNNMYFVWLRDVNTVQVQYKSMYSQIL